jgi:antitoxin component YwqK of YwqJK toxin-antitoxin module
MKYKLSPILIVLCLFSCSNKDNLNDKGKRNLKWVWWTDTKTGKTGWIPVNDPDVERVKDGKYIRFYFNGAVYSKGTMVDGIDVDTTFNYDLKGFLFGYITYKKDNEAIHYFLNNGPIKILYANGKIANTGVVENHTYGDDWISYYDNGKCSYSQNLKKGTGWGTRYYYNGKVEDSDYIERAKTFNLKHWYENGQLEHITEFKNHDKNGVHLQYYKNGQLQASGHDFNGERDGEEKLWYEDGKLQAISNRSKGVLDGKSTIYYENGRVKIDGYYVNGKLEGEIRSYDENGKLILDKIFKNNAVVEDKLVEEQLKNHHH